MDRKKAEQKARELLAGMTLREKIGQLHQTGSTMVSALPGFDADIDRWVTEMLEGRMSQDEFHRRIAMCREDLRLEGIQAGEIGAFVNLYDDEKVAQVLEASYQSRMKIPVLVGVDVIRGYRTIFPTPLAMSCSFDPELFRRFARVAKREAKVCGVNWAFGPMLDIARDARWGRIVESPGEDPYLASEIGKAMIETYQAEDEDGPLMATAKHFAAYGAVSGGQDYNTVSLSKQQLYDVYLPPFRAAVDAGVGAVMSAFHDLNGVPCTCDKWLLNDVLREEMGFDGFVVSDAEAVKQCVVHGVAKDEREAAKLALLAGGDMDMSSWGYVNYLEDLVRSGEITEEDVNRAALRVLTAKARFGILDEVYHYDPEKIARTVLSASHRDTAREAAVRSAVLLKNDGALPITKERKRILVVGALAESREDLLGPWAFTGDKSKVVTIPEGLRRHAPSGAEISWLPGFSVSEDRTGFEEALEACRKADFVIAVAGETAFMSGEAASRADLRLAGAQEEFLMKLAETGVPNVVVLINGRPLAIGKLQENPGIHAILEAWHLGTEAGEAIAALLFGEENPSGKLTVTFAHCGGQEPLYYNHPNTGKPGSAFKFTSKYQDVPIQPLYPFGFGLSYTSFACQDLRVETPRVGQAEMLRCRVTVRNTGTRTGRETVQLYIHDRTASLARPVRELKGFEQVELAPGEEKAVSFRIPAQSLGFWNREGRYQTEPGEFDLFVGSDSRAELHGTFEIV